MKLNAISDGRNIWSTSKKNGRENWSDAFNTEVTFAPTSSAVIQQGGKVGLSSVQHLFHVELMLNSSTFVQCGTNAKSSARWR